MKHDTTTPGALAYAVDCAVCPLHQDGTPRRPWSEIGGAAQWSWNRQPTPRLWIMRRAARAYQGGAPA